MIGTAWELFHRTVLNGKNTVKPCASDGVGGYDEVA
jgi:hypothetical protein